MDEEFLKICFNLSLEFEELCNYSYSNEKDTKQYDSYQKALFIVVPTFFGFIGIIGFIGNMLVILVIAVSPGLRSTTNLLVINLAVADLVFLISYIQFTVTAYVMPSWSFGDLWCKADQYLIVVSAHVSIYTLVLMSFDRFMAVVHPIVSMSLKTEWNTLLVISLTWVVILITEIPVIFCHGEKEYVYFTESHIACIFLEEQNCNKRGYGLSFFLSSYVIPLTLITVLYMCMLIRLWRSSQGGNVSAEGKGRRNGRKKVTRMVIVVVVVFAVCWCPLQVILLLRAVDAYINFFLAAPVIIIAQGLSYINSSVNPLLYAFLSDSFRVTFRKLFCKMKANSSRNSTRVQ